VQEKHEELELKASAGSISAAVAWKQVLREAVEEVRGRELLSLCDVVAADDGLLTVGADDLLACNLVHQNAGPLSVAFSRLLGHPCSIRVMYCHPGGGLSAPSSELLEMKGLQAAEDGMWSEVLLELRGTMTRATYHTWLAATELVGRIGEDTFVVACRNRLAQDWLTHRLQGSVERALSSVVEKEVRILFVPRLAEQHQEA